jgi:hypothetical protein
MNTKKGYMDKKDTVIDYRQIGSNGMRRFSGFIYEEILQELTSWRGCQVYKEMASNDPTISGILFAIDKLCRRVPWRVEAASQESFDIEAAEFLEQCMDDMENTWIDTISEILSFLQYGHSVHEIVYKRRCGASFDPSMRSKFSDGRIGWHSLPIRSQDTLYRWQFSDHGNIQGVEQLAPPHYYHVTIPVEKFLLFRTTIHKGNPEGKSILRGAYTCFSDDTEILTKDGWKLFPDLLENDEVATLNKETNYLEYEIPEKIHEYDHDGDMIFAESRYINQLTTPDHRMWVRKNHKDNFEFIEAKDCNPWVSFQSTANWKGNKITSMKIGKYKINGDIFIQFMAWWLAEGHVRTGLYCYQSIITQKEGATSDEIRSIIKKLPFIFIENKKDQIINFTTKDRDLHEYLKQFGKSYDKFIPEIIKQSSKKQIQLFLETYIKADGGSYACSKIYKGKSYNDIVAVNTVSDKLADDLFEIVLKAGHRPQKRWHHSHHAFNEKGCWMIRVGKKLNQMRAAWSIIEYKGKVYCVTTKNGVVFTRRDGKMTLSGNCWYKKKNIENIEAIGIERDLAGLPMAYVPPEYLSPGASDDQKSLLKAIKDIVVNVRRDEQEGMILPLMYDSNGKQMFDFKLLSTGGSRQLDVDKIINRYDQRIAMSMMADFMLLGSSGQGSYAMHSDKTKLFSMAIGAFLDIIAEIFNRFAIPRLFALNDLKISNFPKIVHSDVESTDLGELGTYLTQLASAGMPLFPNQKLEAHLMKLGNLPEPLDEMSDIDQQVAPLYSEPLTNIKEIKSNPAEQPNGLSQKEDTTPVNGQPKVESPVTNADGNTERTARYMPKNNPDQYIDMRF